VDGGHQATQNERMIVRDQHVNCTSLSRLDDASSPLCLGDERERRPWIFERLLCKVASLTPGVAPYLPAVNGTVAILLSHMIAILPPAFVMSTKAHVSCSTANGSVDTAIAARTTSLSGV